VGYIRREGEGTGRKRRMEGGEGRGRERRRGEGRFPCLDPLALFRQLAHCPQLVTEC
jgi:hypothetical protein